MHHHITWILEGINSKHLSMCFISLPFHPQPTVGHGLSSLVLL